MSGNPKGLGYHRHCKKCREPIVFKKRNGKSHPYNLDGTSHFDTCLYAEYFRPKSLAQRGDIDTYQREKWRNLQVFFEEPVPLDWSAVELQPLSREHLVKILDALEAKGGPCACGVPYPVENIHTLVCCPAGMVKAVVVHNRVYERILAYFQTENPDVKVVVIAGYRLEPVKTVDRDVWEKYMESL